ncbi:ibrB domain protein [Salmonella enterica]|uniref:IbrB domain protein n=1 Tax=Salmonella enterica subsp. enterica serovar Aqua TaxID=1302615 RepID=A0A5X6ES33_SALET|nr:ibrB domain protein [Salmonella enterica]ECA3795427.1 ibrB domain protein [Salmonella enterica subsp. enterica serovar Aqua]
MQQGKHKPRLCGLALLGWKDVWIAKELGMDADEVLRLKQISGLAEMFGGSTFSDAWIMK